MNSKINRLNIAAVVCGLVLAGCNAAEDVRSEPFTPVPVPSGVLEGTLTGLGRLRPVFLDDGIALTGHVREKSFAGTVGVPTVPFSFGAVPQGTPYHITVTNNPYNLVCTVANATGTVGSGAAPPAVTCADNPAITRFTVGGTVTAPAGSLPAGTRVILTTEDGIEEITLNPGQTSFTFVRRVFSTPTSAPPAYAWTVTARYTDSNGLLNNCRIDNGTGSNTTAHVTNVQLAACTFAVTGNVQYSTPPGGTAQAMGAGGVEISLKSLGAAVPDVAPVTINAFSTSVVTLWPTMRSNAQAVYDVVITKHPTGQHCIVRMTNGATGTTTEGSALWLVAASATSSTTFNRDGVSIRCRNKPTTANTLTGTLPAHRAQHGHAARHHRSRVHELLSRRHVHVRNAWHRDGRHRSGTWVLYLQRCGRHAGLQLVHGHQHGFDHQHFADQPQQHAGLHRARHRAPRVDSPAPRVW